MKKLLIVLAVLLSSCVSNKYDEEMKDLDLKNKRLDYLQNLYRVRDDIVWTEKRRTLDSLIIAEESTLNLNK